jgi:hypothetical protein
MAANSAELDRVLSGFPGLDQCKPVESAEFIRFTVQLHIDPSQYHQPPRIFILFTQGSFQQASGALELLFKNGIEQHSFMDASSGKLVNTSLHKDCRGIWTAITIDGSIWAFHIEKGVWVKGVILP